LTWFWLTIAFHWFLLFKVKHLEHYFNLIGCIHLKWGPKKGDSPFFRGYFYKISVISKIFYFLLFCIQSQRYSMDIYKICYSTFTFHKKFTNIHYHSLWQLLMTRRWEKWTSQLFLDPMVLEVFYQERLR
jgi:hypothetical protein